MRNKGDHFDVQHSGKFLLTFEYFFFLPSSPFSIENKGEEEVK